MSDVTAIYADGGVIQTNPSPIGGTWAVCFVDAAGNRVREDAGLLLPRDVLPHLAVSNNVTELYALTRAILEAPLTFRGTFYSDSQVTLCRLFQAGRLNNVPEWLQEDVRIARQRLRVFPAFRYQLLDGHPTRAQLETGIGKRGNPVSAHNVWCDQRCGAEAKAHLAALEAVRNG